MKETEKRNSIGLRHGNENREMINVTPRPRSSDIAVLRGNAPENTSCQLASLLSSNDLRRYRR
jgi:hypothetical protein